jgi:hypothetical protein
MMMNNEKTMMQDVINNTDMEKLKPLNEEGNL